MNTTSNSLITLLRAAMGNAQSSPLQETNIDWEAVLRLADRQHVAALACDGLRRLGIDPGEETRIRFLGHLMLTEKAYLHHKQSLAKLNHFYRSHGFDMMLLKGYGMSLLYPSPSLRAPGDIDLFLWRHGDSERQTCFREADLLIENELGIPVDDSHEHHTTFHFDGTLVENHYDFINIVDLRSSKLVEQSLQKAKMLPLRSELLADDPLLLPPPQFDSLFLSRHTARHFSGSGTNMRHLLDWANFVRNFHEAVDWDATLQFWKQFGLLPFMECVNSVCIQSLGYPQALFHGIESQNQELTQKVLKEIMEPRLKGKMPGGKISSVVFRLRRFSTNGWKRRITYTDSSLSAFFTLLLSRLKTKPSI